MIRIPPKRLLVPLDFSEHSFSAWNLAKDLAKRLGAEVEAVHAEDSIALEMPPFPRRPLTQDVYRELESHLRWRIGPQHRVHIVDGSPVQVILRTVKKRRADMVVMGTHGRAGLPRALLGSVTEAVVRACEVPVLTLRAKWRPIKSVLVPINFRRYSMRGFWAALEFGRALGARVDALYVESDAPQRHEAESLFKSMAARLPARFEGSHRPRLAVRRGDPVVKIVSTARDYDLVVLVSHRKSVLRDTVLGTTAERVLRYSPVPVLALPEAMGESWSRPPAQWRAGIDKLSAPGGIVRSGAERLIPA